MDGEIRTDLIVLGAGAAGLMAALSAAEEGLPVLLLEAGPTVGRKLLLTGGGRCNISNLQADDFQADHYFGHAAFLRPAYRSFGPGKLRSYFRQQNFPLREEEEGRLYPVRGGAEAVCEFLKAKLREYGVRICCRSRVREIRRERDGYFLRSERGGCFRCLRLILTPGGASYPQTGSDGSLLELLSAWGLDVEAFRPALSALRIENFPFRGNPGISFEASLSLAQKKSGPERRACQSFRGSLLITPQGLSGPPALNLSRWLETRKATAIQLNFLPDKSENEILEELANLLRSEKQRELQNLKLPGLTKNLRLPFLAALQLPADKKAAQLRQEELRRIAAALHAFPLSAASFPFSAAMASRGGVELSEIDPRSLEAKKFPGLYFAGEILNLDGECGGYNLQAALATAYLAAKSAAKLPSLP